MTSTHQPGVDVTARTTQPSTILPYVAFVAGLLSVPGSILTWGTSLPGEGFVWGLPVALLAVVLGVAALRARTPARWAASVGLFLGTAMTLMIVVWTILEI
jgi:hypothetical protein